MKRDKFIDNLIRRGGFVQCQNEGAQNWFETYNFRSRESIMVGIMNNDENFPLVTVDVVDDDTEEERAKDYISFNGAWLAILRLLH